MHYHFEKGVRTPAESNETGLDGFVGICCEKNSFDLYVPYGFYYDRNKENFSDIRGQILDILLPIEITKRENPSLFSSAGDEDNCLLFDAYKKLIDDYLVNGRFFESIKVISHLGNGKINWKKTRQGKKIFEEDRVVFENRLYSSNRKEENLISSLQLYCLRKAKESIGVLYEDFFVPSSSIKEDEIDRDILILKRILSQTYNDRKKKIIDWILIILDSNSGYRAHNQSEFGTRCYEVVWEERLRKIYGNTSEKDYFPQGHYYLKNDSKAKDISYLRPDIIHEEKEEIYILDAKYYSYGCSKDRNYTHLPATESLSKQMNYARYALKRMGKDSKVLKVIYNAFVLPLSRDEESQTGLEYFGYGSVDGYQGETYTQIYLFGIQTNKLISCYLSHTKAPDLIGEINSEAIRYQAQYQKEEK